jgi:SlyX protein
VPPIHIPPSLEDRVIELETRLAHQEQVCDDLNEVLVRQSRDMERLKRELSTLQDRLASAADNREPSPQDNRPPPHY